MHAPISYHPNTSTRKKNHTNDNNMIKLDIKILHGLPAPYSVRPPGALLHHDFYLYDVIIVRGFASVLYVIRASTL